jgi:YebC/PmpR family DNA-binding regulatory protein
MGRHNTIAGRKAAQDSKRAASFTKYARAIMIAAKAGGDPDYNPSLRTAIEKAKQAGLPNDNINRAIKKGTGELEGEQLEELRFEGYGAGGVAVIVEALTDNRNRTTSSVSHAFDKFGGNLGTPGCVSYMFDRKGVIVLEKEDDMTEDSVMELALEAGADDVVTYDDSFEILCDPDAYNDVDAAIRAAGFTPVESDIEQVPSVTATPTDNSQITNLRKMVEMLEDNDDVQKVYTNCTVDLYEE